MGAAAVVLLTPRVICGKRVGGTRFRTDPRPQPPPRPTWASSPPLPLLLSISYNEKPRLHQGPSKATSPVEATPSPRRQDPRTCPPGSGAPWVGGSWGGGLSYLSRAWTSWALQRRSVATRGRAS